MRPHLYAALKAFLALRSRVPNGFSGANPIPLDEIHSWAKIYGIDAAWLANLLIPLDVYWVRSLNKMQKTATLGKAKTPPAKKYRPK